MDRLIEINSSADVPIKYQGTPIGLLVEYQNHIRSHDAYASAQILVGMCMDNRKALDVPENFAYILRTGGANMRASGFKISYAIAVGGVRHIVIAGHNHCGMVNLMERKEVFITGLVEGAGWEREKAENHFLNLVPMFEIGNAIDFVLSEVRRLRGEYPKIMIAPLLYRIEDNHLCFIRE
ncbi:MAG: carbonic anhydrase [Candidatus Omnitrophica bacterium]|nr:carbonic anhydrase [Candidatus Omnitrophota bacterium]